MKKPTMLSAVMIVAIFAAVGFCQTKGEHSMNKTDGKTKIVFATFIESPSQIQQVYYLAESIRDFGGRVKDAPIRLYVADYNNLDTAAIRQKFAPLNVEVFSSGAPEEALEFYFAGKVYAAGLAEKQLENSAEILVWMDIDTIFLLEPSAFLLDPGISFAYRPIMHNRSGTLYGQEPGPFWKRIYEKSNVKKESLFKMTTPADNQDVNAYFNAGLLVVRPEKGILRKWVVDFKTLYQDSVIAQMCMDDNEKRIFLHQTALVGPVLNTLKRSEMVELGDDYNYPLFFEQMFGANREFGSIEDVTSLRYEHYFQNPDPEWDKKIKGAPEKINWIKKRLGK